MPSSFCHDVIVLIPKTPTRCLIRPENYRPITIITVLPKLLESILIPKANISESRFGSREGRHPSFGCSFMSDIISLY